MIVVKALKLYDQKGYTHGLVVLGIVFATAAVSAGLLVNEKSKSQDVLGASTASATTGPVTCQIKSVPKHPRHGSVIKPSLVIKNSTSEKYDLNVSYSFVINDKYGQPQTNVSYSGGLISQLNPKSKISSKLQRYSVPYRTDKKLTGTYKANNLNPAFNCSSTFTLPKKPKNAKPDPAPAGGTETLGEIVG